MAVGRVKDPELKVFGNNYPTPCVAVSYTRQIFFSSNSIHRDGTCVRDYLHVLDLASGHLLALDALIDESKVFEEGADNACYKAYNLGKGKGISVLQIVEAMRIATGFQFQTDIIGRR